MSAILIFDDDASMCKMLESGLAAVGHDTVSSTAADTALDLLHARDFDVVITDVRMRGVSGIDLCNRIADTRPDVPVIVITAFGSMESAIEAIRAGAYDFVTKPFELDAIRMAVQRAVNHRSLARKVERLEHALRDARVYEGLIGASPEMRALHDLIARVAACDTAVLITGESGTGKELVARALHRRGARHAGPFVALNCAAMPEALLESELFGHTRGAFTDARADRRGLFVQASGGTLFLDEIGEMPLGLQPKLLRALQEKVVRPVGASVEIPFDARVIAATNRDLERAVRAGRFREDLYYRIHVIQIQTPPLRERDNDILLLTQHFVERFSAAAGRRVTGILPQAAEKLVSYPWPGNVRELQNCIERAVALCRYSELTVDDLPERVREHRAAARVVPPDAVGDVDMTPMDEIERRHVLRVFEATGGNKSLAAKILGFNRKTLYRKLRRYGALPGDIDLEADDGV